MTYRAEYYQIYMTSKDGRKAELTESSLEDAKEALDYLLISKFKDMTIVRAGKNLYYAKNDKEYWRILLMRKVGQSSEINDVTETEAVESIRPLSLIKADIVEQLKKEDPSFDNVDYYKDIFDIDVMENILAEHRALCLKKAKDNKTKENNEQSIEDKWLSQMRIRLIAMDNLAKDIKIRERLKKLRANRAISTRAITRQRRNRELSENSVSIYKLRKQKILELILQENERADEGGYVSPYAVDMSLSSLEIHALLTQREQFKETEVHRINQRLKVKTRIEEIIGLRAEKERIVKEHFFLKIAYGERLMELAKIERESSHQQKTSNDQ